MWALLPRLDCRLQSVEQRRVAEGLEKAGHGAACEQARPQGGVVLRRDEHDWERLSPSDEFLLKLRAAHAWKANVQHERRGTVQRRRPEKVLGRFESLHVVSR